MKAVRPVAGGRFRVSDTPYAVSLRVKVSGNYRNVIRIVGAVFEKKKSNFVFWS
jgi:hypothetical protein